MSDQPTLAQALARFEPAADVDDLETARRFITALRELIQARDEENAIIDDAHMVFLNDEYERKVEILYNRRKLTYEQDDDAYNDEYEFDEVFEDFVRSAIDVAWDLAQSEDEATRHGDRVTPSA